MNKTTVLSAKGFTLIELLVVVLIIGILTGIALPQYSRSVRRAEMTEGLTHGKTIYDSAVRYRGINGEVPTSFDQLDIAFLDANITGNEFNDGAFTYVLPEDQTVDYVKVVSNHGDYELRFIFPIRDSDGVYAPLGCCPGSSTTGQWLCNGAGQEHNYTSIASMTGCREIR